MAITNITMSDNFIARALNDAIEKRANEIMHDVIEKAKISFSSELAKALPTIILKVQSYIILERRESGVFIDVRVRND